MTDQPKNPETTTEATDAEILEVVKGVPIEELRTFVKERVERLEEEEQERQIEAEWEKILESVGKTEEISSKYAGDHIGEVLDRIIKEKIALVVKRKRETLSILIGYDSSPYKVEDTISSQKLGKGRLFDSRKPLFIYRDARRSDRIQAVLHPAPKNLPKK